MKTCPECDREQASLNSHCSECGYHFKKEEESEAGKIGLGFDTSCGSIEPTIKLGGGIGLGMDGHITFGGF